MSDPAGVLPGTPNPLSSKAVSPPVRWNRPARATARALAVTLTEGR